MDKRNRTPSDKNSDEESALLVSGDSSKRKCNDSDSNRRLFTVGSSSDTEYVGKCSSDDSVVFDSKVRSSREPWTTKKESGRMKRAHSWSAGNTEDDSEVRILRERLVRTQTCPRVSAIRLLSRRQRLTLASLALVDFMSFCSMSIMAPFFPREATEKGLSDTMCGFVFSFYAVVMFFTSPLFGKFLPVVGAKFMFTFGMFIAGGCNVIFGTLVMVEDGTLFTVLCFLVRGLEALGASAYSTASYVFVVNSFPDNIGSVLGILETFVGLGMSVGPALGGLLYSIGGFGLPFYSLGIVMVLSVPINFFLLDDTEEYVSGSKTGSIMRLFMIPSIIITGLVIVIVSNTWAFLDPTLEPHLRQFGLTTQQIGLIFLLFSSLYAIFSPIWGWVADRVHNHWCMMVWGLFLSALGLLLLGPCPFIPGLPPDLWLDLVALCILGMSVALTLLPTFQGVLTSSIKEGGCPEAVGTYSAVAGVWSCCYSLGEVIGPALGGALTQRLGFPFTATICAGACFVMAVITAFFFSIRESLKPLTLSESVCSDLSTWSSDGWRPPSESTRLYDSEPLIYHDRKDSYGTTPPPYSNDNKSMRRSASANILSAASYFIKFQYLTDGFRRLLQPSAERLPLNKTPVYSNKANYGTIPQANGTIKRNSDTDFIEFLNNTRSQSRSKLPEPSVSFNIIEVENMRAKNVNVESSITNVYGCKSHTGDKYHVSNGRCRSIVS